MNTRDRFLYVLATCFGLGLLPIAPGTWGALLGVAIYAAVRLADVTLPVQTAIVGGSLLIVSVLTVALSPWSERHWKKKDPGNFVTDEVAGYLMTVLLFPVGANLPLTLLWTFVVTRGLDIVKIPPARQLEYLHGGWGILLDDLMSSIYAAGVLWGAYWVFPAAFGG